MINKIKEQLTDSGAVIGYRPDLRYGKEISNTDAVNKGEPSAVSGSPVAYSATVNSVLNNLPSKTISVLNDVLEGINEAIDRLSEEFDKTKYKDYGNIESFINAISNNEEYADSFLNYHKNDISKSSIPETLYILIKSKERVELLEETFKKLYYGDPNISQQEAEKKDNELKELITEKDTAGVGINYLSLSYDAIVNKAFSIFGYTLDTAVLQIEQSALVSEATTAKENKNLATITKRMFDEANNSFDDRTNTYNIQQSIDTMQKTLYNYYGKRSELNQYYEIVSAHSSDGSYLLSQLKKFEDAADTSIENMNKSLLGNIYYLNSMEEILTEKQYLRSLYATLSYN